MKNSFSISSILISTFIGAGFASGAEILVFFGGPGSLWGILLTGILILLCSVLILNRVYTEKIQSFGEYLNSICGKKLSLFILYLSDIFLVCIFCTMVSGAGAMTKQHFDVSYFWGSFLFSLICVIVFLFGLNGILVLSNILSPFMITTILLLCVASMSRPAFSSWLFAKEVVLSSSGSVLYISYNLLTLTPVLCSLNPLLKNKKTAIRGGLLGGGILFVTLLFLYFSLRAFPEATLVQIPFLYIAARLSPFLGDIYFLVLVSAMLTTAVSCGFGFIQKRPRKKAYSILLLFCLSLLSIPLGFTVLVGKLYTLFGILGLVLFFCIIKKF